MELKEAEQIKRAETISIKHVDPVVVDPIKLELQVQTNITEHRVEKIQEIEKEQSEVTQKLADNPQSPTLSRIEMSAAQIKQRTLEQAKMEEMKKLREQQRQAKLNPPAPVFVEKPVESFPSVQQKPLSMMGLPSIGQRGGNFGFDDAYLKKANAELNKLNAIGEWEDPKPTLVEDTRTMAEVLKDKRALAEAKLEESK